MPRFFFNVRHCPGPEGIAVDPEGEEFADVDAARQSAVAQVRIMLARERHTFIRDWIVCSFEVMNEDGQPVLTVPFSDTVPENNEDCSGLP